MNLVIIGARRDSGVATLIDFIRESGSAMRVVAFIDEHAVDGQEAFGHPVLRSFDDLGSKERLSFVACIGQNAARRRLSESALAYGLAPFTLVHPSCVVSASARLGTGCILFPRATVNGGAMIGDGTILNTGAIVEHDGVVGPYCNLGPGFVSGGRVRLDEEVYAGLGVVILPDVRIGAGAVLGAGTVVTRDVSPKAVVKGVPGHPS